MALDPKEYRERRREYFEFLDRKIPLLHKIGYQGADAAREAKRLWGKGER
jgi:hypothetical protein